MWAPSPIVDLPLCGLPYVRIRTYYWDFAVFNKCTHVHRKVSHNHCFVSLLRTYIRVMCQCLCPISPVGLITSQCGKDIGRPVGRPFTYVGLPPQVICYQCSKPIGKIGRDIGHFSLLRVMRNANYIAWSGGGAFFFMRRNISFGNYFCRSSISIYHSASPL